MAEHNAVLGRRHRFQPPAKGVYDPRQWLPGFHHIARGSEKANNPRLSAVRLVRIPQRKWFLIRAVVGGLGGVEIQQALVAGATAGSAAKSKLSVG
jgi:hypothetical protein